MAVATATALAIAAIGVSAAGTAVSIYGQKQQAATAAAVGNYNAKLKQNAAIQEDMDSRESIRREREKNLLFIGAQRAKTAISGLAQEGSPLEILAYDAGSLELRIQDEARAADNRYRGGMAEADAIRMGANATSGAYKTAAFGTLLSGTANIAGQIGDGMYKGTLPGGKK